MLKELETAFNVSAEADRQVKQLSCTLLSLILFHVISLFLTDAIL